MVPGRQCPLPWVPDLVGKESDQRGGVLVVGSAYSPFIAGLAQRNARLALSRYENATDGSGWTDFQKAFLQDVVQKDSDYYPQSDRCMPSPGGNRNWNDMRQYRKLRRSGTQNPRSGVSRPNDVDGT
jgi:hypothetical protein